MSNCSSCGNPRRLAQAAWDKAIDALGALAAGKMPTQQQIDAALNYLLSSDLFKVDNRVAGTLSTHGQSLVLGVRAILEAVVRIGKEKNAGDLIQDVIWQSRLMSAVPVHALLSLLLTSSAFRLLLLDILITMRQILADTADEIAEERIAEGSPDRIKQAIVERIAAIAQRVQGNPVYRASLETLVTLCENYASIATQVTAAGNSTARPLASIHLIIETDPHLKRLLGDLRTLLERFAGGHSLSSLGDSMKQFFTHLFRDETSGVSDLLRDAKTWLREALGTPGWLTTRAARQELDELYDRTMAILNSKPHWGVDLQNVLAEASAFSDHLKQDTATQQLLGAIDALGADMRALKVESARSANWRRIRAGLWRDAVGWLLPRILAILKEIPLLQVELKTEALDLVVDDVAFRAPSSLSDYARVEAGDAAVEEGGSRGKGWIVEGDSVLRVHVEVLRIIAHKIEYVFRYKSALLDYRDKGLLCIDLGHESAVEHGLTLDVELEIDLNTSADTPVAPDSDARPSFFRVRSAVVDAPVLEFKLTDTHHWFINRCVRPFLRPIVRARVSEALSQSIKGELEVLGYKLGEVYARAKEEVGEKGRTDGSSNEPGVWDWWNALLKTRRARSHTKQGEEEQTKPQTEAHATIKKGKAAHSAKKVEERRNVERDRKGWKSEAFNL